jgi:hypothetical protein
MRKFIALVLIVGLLLLGGCSNAWYEHDTVYKTNDHMWYSLGGYHNTDAEDLNTQTRQGGWWGDEIPYIPAD